MKFTLVRRQKKTDTNTYRGSKTTFLEMYKTKYENIPSPSFVMILEPYKTPRVIAAMTRTMQTAMIQRREEALNLFLIFGSGFGG